MAGYWRPGDRPKFYLLGLVGFVTIDPLVPPPVVPGEVNTDHVVNLSDYLSFVDYLIGPFTVRNLPVGITSTSTTIMTLIWPISLDSNGQSSLDL